ncbi:DUF421 domain-containing protein [Proteinivorax hydrogeniformans]|uniref:DUF421 domain-containing protein n=1 Tax=Proteinivorax hydrogeniformans TaxID=1826727 RepID=A0AAU8HVP5_9FIRM
MLNSFYFTISIELITGFFALLVSIKVIGKRQVSQITPFDFISAIVLGEIVGNAIYDQQTNAYHLIFGVSLWTILIYTIEKLSQKFQNHRKKIQGSPTFLIKKGNIDFNQLSKEKLDFNELLSLLRERDVFSVQEVEYAILETSGEVTVIKKSLYNQPTNQDLGVDVAKTSLNLPVILDGEIATDNLDILGYDETWLKNKLTAENVDNYRDILYAEWSEEKGLYVQFRKESLA